MSYFLSQMHPINFDKSTVVVVIPSFNEGKRVEEVVLKVKSSGYHRMIVVDDCSEDGSTNHLKDHEVIVLHHLINRGAGAATETGLKYCRDFLDFDAVVTIDADTQHDAADIDSIVSMQPI